jgi:SAM-dependent methyltransferase
MSTPPSAGAPAQLQRAVEQFWNQAPCGSALSRLPAGSREYFEEVERERYRYEGHILEVLDLVRWQGRRVLEVGAGVGTDGRQIIARGAIYTGLNVDAGSTRMAGEALARFGLPGYVIQCSATGLPLPDRSVEVVYSFGVLAHIPEVERAMAEIRRVLKPGGEVLAMLYNRDSINYRIEIRLLRRWLRRLLLVPGAIAAFSALGLPRAKMERHAELARSQPEMTEQEWLSRNTDGPDNPYTTVYDAAEAQRLFSGFEVLRQELYFFDARHWGVLGRALPSPVVRWLGRRWGWHRIVHARLPATL